MSTTGEGVETLPRPTRVLHVVSGMSPDNRFGGVTRVAFAIGRAQQRAGKHVVLAGAALGYPTLPRRLEGLRVILGRGANPVPALGLGAVVAPSLLARLVRPMLDADLIHIHFGRDLVTLSAALLARLLGRPFIVQTHGMLDAPTNAVARVIDVVLTRPALRGASTALVLVDEERGEVGRLSRGRLAARAFPNGVVLPNRVVPLEARAEEVVFLARLHPRKGAVVFTEAALRLGDLSPERMFRILGPDEGDAPGVREALAQHGDPAHIRLEGPVAHAEGLRVLAEARVLVLPAVEEPFGMTLIEAMAAGTPVVVHESAALAPAIVADGAGLAFGPTSALALTEAISLLLEDGRWRAASEAARTLVERRFTLGSVIADLELIYADVILGRRVPPSD